MAHYVDGYVLPVPKRNIDAYRRMAQKAGKIWREHGALDYRECVGEDLDVKMALPFPRGIKVKPGETVVFAWIVFKSRAHRDRVRRPTTRKSAAIAQATSTTSKVKRCGAK